MVNYIKLNEEQLKHLQSDILLLLVELDRICKEHDIKYYLAYGTLIGAVRHKGFVPWDDDIDVQMLRNDYEKFCDLCKKELNTERFFLQTQETDIFYNWVYGKLRLKDTSYIRAGQEHIKQEDGIFLDILPLDNISNSKLKITIINLVCKICRKILWSQVGKKNANKLYLKLIYKLLSYVPRNIVIMLFEKFAKWDKEKETSLLASHNTFKQTYKSEWYRERVEVNFEGKTFFAPKGYTEILTLVYGDFMKIPPEDQREGHCSASYIKFKDGTEILLNE